MERVEKDDDKNGSFPHLRKEEKMDSIERIKEINDLNDALIAMEDLDKALAAKETELSAEREKVREWELDFRLYHNAIRRGTAMYREAHPGTELMLPSTDKLVCWLIEQLAALQARLAPVEEVYQYYISLGYTGRELDFDTLIEQELFAAIKSAQPKENR